MSPDLQKVLTDAIVILIPAFAGWIVSRLSKAKKDTDAAFQKLRAHEEQLGIETRVVRGKISVTSRPASSKADPALDSGSSSEENGRSNR